jgi:hypothetical protein
MGPEQREAPLAGDGAAEGLSWFWQLDIEALLAALAEPAPWHRSPRPAACPAAAATNSSGEPAGVRPADADAPTAAIDPVEADFADYLDAIDSGRSSVIPLSAAAGRVAEILPPSPDLAAWLACDPVDNLEDGALAGAAAAYRRLAAWAQAGELAVVARMASRSAAADKSDGTGGDGRPGRISADAYGQVSLALTLSQAGAEWWTNLAVDLRWRLAATGIALREGTIDLARAKAIVEATGSLDEDKARAVEAKVLPRAGQQTTAQLRASLRRAVITADPEGAERRREEAERRAKVTLYPDAEGTASLAGQNLPGVRAAAAFARITALARALKADGADGGIDLLRSKVLLGLLLGTLPYIPPAPGGPTDADCPPGDGPGGAGPGFGGAGAGDPAEGSGGDCPSAPSDPMPWPEATPFVQAGPAALKNLPPVGSGFLDLRLPWLTLAQGGPEPGYLTRLGPVTPGQAGQLAALAAADAAVDWRVVLTDGTGRAISVARARPASSLARSARASPASSCSLLRRVTVVISADELTIATRARPPTDDCQHAGDCLRTGDGLAEIRSAIISAARHAADQAAERAAADAAAGGCAHIQASPAYQVPVRLREFVNLRDLTCRFPTCRQPAQRCDADHTRPYEDGGPTCCCNLGPLCRYHHQLKQHRLWCLTQPAPGTFTWTTPTGRTYAIEPDSQAA